MAAILATPRSDLKRAQTLRWEWITIFMKIIRLVLEFMNPRPGWMDQVVMPEFGITRVGMPAIYLFPKREMSAMSEVWY